MATEFEQMVANTISQRANSVCAACGLEYVGHAIEAKWLGLTKHDYMPIEATPIMKARARELTKKAYQMRP